MENQRIIMAIGGHIGDMELTAGGTLATMALEGAKIITVALTAGEKGNPKHLSVADYRKQKIEEAKIFAKKMNDGIAVVFDYGDGELPDNDEVRWQLADLIREHKPNVLITHWKNSMHKDHELTYKITKDAQFYAGLPSFERDFPAHFAAGPYYAENWEDPTDFKPYIYSVISEEGFKLWQEAIQGHWFAMNSTSYDYFNYYSQLKGVRGINARRKYAECFDIEELQKRVIREGI